MPTAQAGEPPDRGPDGAAAETRDAEERGGETAPVDPGTSGASVGPATTMVCPLEGDLGESHAGDLRRESAEVRAERIIAEELRRQGWRGADLAERRKSDPVKLALAARLRRQTTPCLPAGR